MGWQTAQTSEKNVTPRDYFFLSSHKFPQRGSFLEGWEVISTETFYQHGLVAICFVNTDIRHVVIAFQMFDEIQITQDCLDYARDFVKHAKQLAQRLDYKVSYTGKLKGGTVAELCAIQDKLLCYTFDSESIDESKLL